MGKRPDGTVLIERTDSRTGETRRSSSGSFSESTPSDSFRRSQTHDASYNKFGTRGDNVFGSDYDSYGQSEPAPIPRSFSEQRPSMSKQASQGRDWRPSQDVRPPAI